MALDDVCLDHRAARKLSGTVLDSGGGSPARMFRKKPSIALESWSARWSRLTQTEATTLRTAYESAGPGGAVSWTPPGEGSSRAFCIHSFSESARSANNFEVDMELHYMPGVTV